MTNFPKVSVVMPVYNGEKYLEESIDSILNQTFTDFEFIIVNDGSSDQSEEIIRNCQKKDDQIHLITNPNNLGIAEATNVGISYACGEYIALMDQDDISMPERLEKEVDFLDSHPDISVVGANSIRLDEDGNQYTRRDLLETPGLIRWGLLFRNQIQNPTAMIRKALFLESNLKYENFMPSQDYNFWLRISNSYKFANLQDNYLLHRLHGSNASKKFEHLHNHKVQEILRKFIKEHMNYDISTDTITGLSNPCQIRSRKDADLISKIIIKWYWLNKKSLTAEEKHYVKNKTSRMLRDIWYSQKRDMRLFHYVIISIMLDF